MLVDVEEGLTKIVVVKDNKPTIPNQGFYQFGTFTCYNNREPRHIERECPLLAKNRGTISKKMV